MKKATTTELKSKAGFARSKKYHQRNLEEVVETLQKKNKNIDPTIVRLVVSQTYALFRARFTFFKK